MKFVNQIIFQTKGYLAKSHLDISKYVPNDQLLNSRCILICIKELTFIVDTHCSCIIHTFSFLFYVIDYYLLLMRDFWTTHLILHRSFFIEYKKCDNNKNHSKPIKEILQETQGAITMSSSQSNASKASGKNIYHHFCIGYVFWIVIFAISIY